jgi:hypothetical protein
MQNCIVELVALNCSRLNPPLTPAPWAEAHHANSGLGPADVTVPITRQTLFLLPTIQLSKYRAHEDDSRWEYVSHRRLVLTAPPDHIRTCPYCQGAIFIRPIRSRTPRSTAWRLDVWVCAKGTS